MTFAKEKDLFPVVKKLFKEKGYSVYAEVAHFLRGIDLVAVNEKEHIAVELKLHFNADVVRQAYSNSVSFDKVYIAFPVKKPILFHSPDVYWKLRERTQNLYDRCENIGIGILEIMPSGVIFEALEPRQQTVMRKMDFSHHVESEDDIGGVPSQKGVSAGYYEMETIKDYVRKHPTAKWQEIYDNVHTHYANARSLAGAMGQWRGFNLAEFKKTLLLAEEKIEQKLLL